MLGLVLKKLVGLNNRLTCSTGITGQSSGLGICVIPVARHKTSVHEDFRHV